jgi:hypothetical protein
MKIHDKLVKVDDSFTVHMYDNGFMFDIGGRDADDEWTSARIMCEGIDQVADLVKEAAQMGRNADLVKEAAQMGRE